MALKNRKDMDPRFQWKLSDIFETPEAWEAAYAKAKKAVEELGALEGTLKQSAESLKSGLDQIYAATEQVELVYLYASLSPCMAARHRPACRRFSPRGRTTC